MHRHVPAAWGRVARGDALVPMEDDAESLHRSGERRGDLRIQHREEAAAAVNDVDLGA